jgi:hypothetical protein
MTQSSISFLVHCPICNRNVSATTVLNRTELTEALARNADVRAVHMADEGDHQWSLPDTQKSNLHKRMTEGLV